MDERSKTVSEPLKNRLNTNWVVWFHNPVDKSWSRDSYKHILELQYVEDLLILNNNWDNYLPKLTDAMYFIMRKINGKIIYPQWEDVNNKYGGYWSFKVDNANVNDIWNKLSKYLIGENICASRYDPLMINGISISPKKTFCIIKIWNNNSKYNQTGILLEELGKFLDIANVKYASHNKNIERDYGKSDKKYNGQRGQRGHRNQRYSQSNSRNY
tara:strand:- start:1049 stop:1690 length:642 start_codon:yes stop_codon:yes gene_type:complete